MNVVNLLLGSAWAGSGRNDTPCLVCCEFSEVKMTYRCTVPTSLEQGPVIIRRLRSISPAQADIVAQAVATVAAEWRVESHDDYDGYLSIVISSDDEDAPTFAISGRTNAIELCEMRDDALQARGCFCAMDDTAGALIGLMRSV